MNRNELIWNFTLPFLLIQHFHFFGEDFLFSHDLKSFFANKSTYVRKKFFCKKKEIPKKFFKKWIGNRPRAIIPSIAMKSLWLSLKRSVPSLWNAFKKLVCVTWLPIATWKKRYFLVGCLRIINFTLRFLYLD